MAVDNQTFVKSAREFQNERMTVVNKFGMNDGIIQSYYEPSGSITAQQVRHIPRNIKEAKSAVTSKENLHKESWRTKPSVPEDNMTHSFMTSQETHAMTAVSPQKYQGKKPIKRNLND